MQLFHKYTELLLPCALSATLIACGGSDTPAPPTSNNTTAPVVSQAPSIAQAGSTRLSLSWTAATDDNTASSALTYNVYLATASGAQNFAVPDATTTAGATSYVVTGLTATTTYFVVVRAEDNAMNEDNNLLEFSLSTAAAVSFAADVQPIFTVNCATSGCHQTTQTISPASGLDLSSGNAHMELVDMSSIGCPAGTRKLVIANKPDDS